MRNSRHEKIQLLQLCPHRRARLYHLCGMSNDRHRPFEFDLSSFYRGERRFWSACYQASRQHRNRSGSQCVDRWQIRSVSWQGSNLQRLIVSRAACCVGYSGAEWTEFSSYPKAHHRSKRADVHLYCDVGWKRLGFAIIDLQLSATSESPVLGEETSAVVNQEQSAPESSTTPLR